MYHLRAILLLTVVYLALTANLQLSNIMAGLLLSVLIVLLLRPASKTVDWRFLPATTWALIRYAAVLAFDLLVSGIQVARIVLSPQPPIQQGNIAIPTTCQSETAQALSAHAITLTPGEMVVEMGDKGTMYTHVLDAGHAGENMANAQRKREQMLNKIMP
jgi:multisubunit Na+/H+ antiporter MnhE subunit